jgi:hypothetical protein
MKILHTAIICVGLAFLCSCATQNSNHSQLPADVTMNKEAGRGGLLLVTFRLADGEKLPLMVDTGSTITLFDKSLEPKLGQRIDTGTIDNFGVTQKIGVYAALKLYLGNVPLRMTGTNAFTFDRQQLASRFPFPFMGVLGMDVLQNYCIQLDFTAGKMRFLDEAHADKTNWGKPFPLTKLADRFAGVCMAIDENLTGVADSKSIIDTGYNEGGWLTPKLFQQWTNQISPPAKGELRAPNGVLGRETYHDLDLNKLVWENDADVGFNGIGLRVLAQNLVTLDFPNRMMYLKHTSDWPLVGKDKEAMGAAMAKSTLKFLFRLKQEGQLPGFSKNDKGKTIGFLWHHNDSPYLDSATWDNLKNGGSDIYHYTFTRTSKHGSWKLQKAWRTDASGKMLEEYPVP